jgi:ABC-type amino acid transport substrate-binding protein
MKFKFNQSFKKADGTAICMLACFVAVSVGKIAVTAAEPSAEPVYKIVSPVGESTAKMTAMARRLDTLEGKTVALVWNHAFKADVTLPAIAEALKQKYPGIKIVPYTSLPTAPLPDTPGSPRRESDALVAAFKANHVDAVITGNGG